MKADDFLSCPDELLSSAIAYGEWLQKRGYKVKIEPWDLAFPNTPLFVATRNRATLIVEVMEELNWPRIEEWAKYGKACAGETRVMVGLQANVGISPPEHLRLADFGVGVAVWDGTSPMEAIAPQDLALNAALPSLPPALAPLFGHAYDQFARGDWREGFEEACLVLEQEARAYLKKHMGKRIQIVGPSGISNPSAAKIGRMTLGALGETFAKIQSPNQADSRIGESLKRINKDRVSVVHYKNVSVARENSLRKSFGKHMMVVVNAMKIMRDIN